MNPRGRRSRRRPRRQLQFPGEDDRRGRRDEQGRHKRDWGVSGHSHGIVGTRRSGATPGRLASSLADCAASDLRLMRKRLLLAALAALLLAVGITAALVLPNRPPP